MYRLAKMVLDRFLALFLLILFSPLFVLAGTAIFVSMGAPLLFRQLRPGLKGKPFLLVKYRTMRSLRDGQGQPFPDSERLTRLGRFLRSLSLDELPELINVARGDMSLVGPRPLLMEYLPLYTQEQFRRHEVRPGITGLAQVSGRNELSWEEKFRLDIWYVDHMSFWLDVKILAMTLAKIIKREGINQPGQATMEEFKGRLP